MKKQSSIEYLYERLERMMPRTSMYNIDKEDYFNKAKQMHKQEIFLAHIHNRCLQDQTYECSIKAIEDAENYYNDNFKLE